MTPIPQEKVKIPGHAPKKYKPTLRERIDDVIHAEVGTRTEGGLLKPETRFAEDLGADSLVMTEMICALEDEFEIPEIPDEIIDNLIFVEDVYKLIEKQVAKNANSID